MYLIRGNHETRQMTEQYGFQQECLSKANRQIYTEFCDMFDYFPLAAVISSKIFCVHGGITPTLSTLSQIREIPRPADISFKGFLADLLWSDPSPDVDDWGPSERGDTVMWNLNPVKKFLDDNNLTMLVRAHQLVDKGYEYPFAPEDCVITVFSAPCYAGENVNRGAFLTVEKDLVVTPILMPHVPAVSVGRVGKQEPMKGKPKGKKDKMDKKGKKGGKGRHKR
jgi:serine/threonine-protein phosphatase PP1 catalytic subunit